MGISCKPILPSKTVSAARAQKSLDDLLLNCKEEAMRLLQTYPTWRPWSSRPPLTGPRAGGKRTGTLGRGWGSYTLRSGKQIELTNATSYAQYVQGNSKTQQARALARRGWTTVDVVGPAAAKAAISRTKLDA